MENEVGVRCERLRTLELWAMFGNEHQARRLESNVCLDWQ